MGRASPPIVGAVRARWNGGGAHSSGEYLELFRRAEPPPNPALLHAPSPSARGATNGRGADVGHHGLERTRPQHALQPTAATRGRNRPRPTRRSATSPRATSKGGVLRRSRGASRSTCRPRQAICERSALKNAATVSAPARSAIRRHSCRRAAQLAPPAGSTCSPAPSSTTRPVAARQPTPRRRPFSTLRGAPSGATHAPNAAPTHRHLPAIR